MHPAHQSLRKKILLPLGALLVVALALVTLEQGISFRTHLETRLVERANRISSLIHFIAGSTPKPEELQHMVSTLGGEPDVNLVVVVAGEPARVVASSRMVLVHQSPDEITDPNIREDLRMAITARSSTFRFDKKGADFDYFHPLSIASDGSAGKQLERGAVLVTLDTHPLRQQLFEMTAKAIAGYFATALTLAVFCWFLLRRQALQPLKQIGDAVVGFQAGDANRLIDASHFPRELAQLAGAWNGLVDRLDEENLKRAKAEEALRQMRDELEVRVVQRTSDLARTHESLRESEEMLRRIMDSSPDCIKILDLEGRVIWMNDGGQRMMEIDDFKTVGNQLWAELWPSKEQPAVWAALELAKKNQVGKFTGCALTAKGSPHWWEVVVTPMLDPAGIPERLLAISRDITERRHAEAETLRLNGELVDASRQAGMAEVATSVLHNVGNVLNSVNISATIAAETMRHSCGADVIRLAGLLQEHRGDLPKFLASAQGLKLPDFLTRLGQQLSGEQQKALAELQSLGTHIDHIKEIVEMQQTYARRAGLSEELHAESLVEDAIRLNAAAFDRHGVKVIRDFSETPMLEIDKHKALQILVNLVRNAKYAMDEPGAGGKRMTLRIRHDGAGFVNISVCDEGVGIPAENLTRIFGHGFTTRKEGHGFGLHSAALAAKEMHGSLTAHSDGSGKGARFTLALPLPAPRTHS